MTWSTASEKNNSHFEIEKSFDGQNWTKLALFFGNGTTSAVSTYSFKDKENAALVYYRIRQVDIDGTATYTGVRVVKTTLSGKAKIYSSAKNNITIELGSNVSSNLSVTVVNLAGQVIAQKSFTSNNRISMDLMNSSGVHVVRVQDEKGLSQTQKIIL